MSDSSSVTIILSVGIRAIRMWPELFAVATSLGINSTSVHCDILAAQTAELAFCSIAS